MKRASSQKSEAPSAAAGKATNGGAASAIAGPVVQLAAAHANDLADALYERAKESINRAQRSVTHVNLETVWQRAQPLLIRAGRFVRDYPARSGMIVALLAGAALLTRTPTSKGAHR